MISELNHTPKALRFHIGIFGSVNVGKSTLVNLISGQEISLTSGVAGTTADPVFKPMELNPLGAVVLIDTAGLDDGTELGGLRMKKTKAQLKSCDAAIFVVSSDETDSVRVKSNLKKITSENIPTIIVINSIGNKKPTIDFSDTGLASICVDFHDSTSAEKVKSFLISSFSDKQSDVPLTANLVKKGDFVLLVAPQDIQAPKGRLILPEVQVIRDLLDNGCVVTMATTNTLSEALSDMKALPNLVVTDSQIFSFVNEVLPKDVPLTSFSLLLAKTKGDIEELVSGAAAIETLCDNDKVVIMESCSHHALDGDIARIKIPALLRKYTGKQLDIVNLSGQEISADMTDVKLIIHCAGCMVNRKAFLSKQRKYAEMGIPMTNFGVAIAYMNKMLGRVCY